MEKIHIRLIEKNDNAALAKIIRQSLSEFGANKPGTVYFDKSTDHLYELFEAPKALYNILLINDEVVGGAGIFPTDGLEEDTCELVKMYLSKASRGKGLGKRLLLYCMNAAKENGFKKMYIETMPELTVAIPMYEKFGFNYLQKPMGNSGHTGCKIWMLKDLQS
jgi:putative acetyltransferase